MSNALRSRNAILMEGALAERLRHEHGLTFFDRHVALASLVYDRAARNAMCGMWREYYAIACKYGLPFIATAPTRRANSANAHTAGYSADIISDNVNMLRDIQRECAPNMYVGCLLDGTAIAAAIREIDAAADHAPLCYMTTTAFIRRTYI